MKRPNLKSTPNIILSIILLVAIVFSIIQFVRAITPNPGHPASEIDFNVVTKNSTTTLTASETVVLADASTAPFTITLPPVSNTPYTVFFIKKIDAALANIITIQGSGGETIDGLPFIQLKHRGEGVMLQSDGTNWRVLGRNQYSLFAYRTKGSALNQWYSAPRTGVAMMTGAPSANNLRVIPFITEKLITIDQMAIMVTTAASGSYARIGIYRDNGNNYPGALVVEATSVTPISTGPPTGVKIATNGLPVTLEPGLYWLAIVGSAAPTLRTFSTASMIPVLGSPPPFPTAAQFGWIRPFAYNPLPNPFPPTGASLITGTPIPAIFVRISQ